ncbi:NACHT domain-containing protein [Streptomyces tauricus]|uniref:NACHT domain-containing protein n=1 Tax=Streptomyces tauricus TaxID=68274 RepID=UPI00387F3600
MQGLEVVLVRLASTVASTLAKSLLTPKRGAGLVSSPVRPLPRPAGPDRLAKVLSARISAAYPALPEHERLAAVAAVQDTFATADPLDAERLFALDLDPARVRDSLRAAPEDLSDRARDLYDELLALCCAHLVEQLTADPSFAARAAVEQTRRAGRAEELLSRLSGHRPEAVALGFEQRYAEFVADTHGRMELYGLTLGNRARAEWSLDTAYISLTVSDERPEEEAHREGLGPPRTTRTSVKVEQALAGCERLVLRGPAGSGKSTLVQWLALNAARRGFGPELADWNLCVPFVLRLRSFNTPDGLPLPQDFLPAAGVPLRAPDGWVEELMVTGRALVLVDGVDEVPTRLRGRTEKWLKSLVTAFPRARYVVTTRPAAVPENWLAAQGFAAHSLLPMERDDVRSFIGHWHDSARQESPPGPERTRLNEYESALNQAVTTRRDLGRLATNPLMCALLCALNRDRRMHLPRARKELYDAALDMLLVRRDSERDIGNVEGVRLTREEQTALLQRMAYWMIRNQYVEADRRDLVAMLGEWLTAMPQVRGQGDAEQVFAHLLIRSGLLRETVPGYVDFVHRTFLDYLAAKAAVEARDFGVLVRNAHDDQWDDVVRMAVGHARVEERGRLLRQLLRRADKARRHRQRLTLLAAASLEHAPELDPAVRSEVEARTAELMPPRSLEEAEALAKVGELVLELLPGPEGLDDVTASSVVHAAALVGGEAGLGVIARFREATHASVTARLIASWSYFGAREYAARVLAEMTPTAYLAVRTPEQLAELPGLRHLTRVHLVGRHGFPPELMGHEGLKYLYLDGDRGLRDLSPLALLPGLETFVIRGCPQVRDLEPLRGLGLRGLYLHGLAQGMSLAPVAELPALKHLTLGFPAGVEHAGDIPAGPGLAGLVFTEAARNISVDGLERWPGITLLAVVGEDQTEQLTRIRHPPEVRDLRIDDHRSLDLAALVGHQELNSLWLRDCTLVSGLGPLTELPHLTILRLGNCGAPIDLTPLAAMEHLVVHAPGDTPLLGTEHFPPERLNPWD